METGSLRDYGVVVLPDLLTATEAIALSERVLPHAELNAETGRPDIRLSLEPGRIQIPHVSLMHVRLKESREAALVHMLDMLVAPPRSILRGRLSETRLVAGTWAFWQVNPNPELIHLHLGALELFAPLRDGDITNPTEMSLNDSQREAARRYGFLNAGQAYDPHITFGYVRAGTVLPPASSRADWCATHVAVVRLGPRGTVVEVIRARSFVHS